MVRGIGGVGGVCEMCICLARSGVGVEWVRGLCLGFTNPVGAWGVLDMCLCLGCGAVGCVREGSGWLLPWFGRVGGVMSVCVVSLDSLCRWQVQVSVDFARRIPAHLRCTH